MLQIWSHAYPHWSHQLETLGAFSLAGLIQASATKVDRLEYLATFSLGINKSIYRVIKCGEALFHELHPGFKHWCSLVKYGSSSKTKRQKIFLGFFEYMTTYERRRRRVPCPPLI